MNGDTLKAGGIDFVGLVLMAIVWVQFAYNGVSMNQTLFAAGLLFPLASYVITYRYYRGQFWTAFLLSFVIAVALIFAGMAVFMGVPF